MPAEDIYYCLPYTFGGKRNYEKQKLSMRNYWSTETDAVKVSPSLLKAGWQERGRNVLERVEGVGDIETRRCIKDCRDSKKQNGDVR